MPFMLELFSDTGSVGKVAKEMGYTVVSLDRDMKASIQVDIMDWDYTRFNPKLFDVVWASPPCTARSRAKSRGDSDIDGLNEIVKRTLDILEYFQPKYWIIEHPPTGLLKDQPSMLGVPYNDIDYCKYGMPYKKRTRLWNNLDLWKPKPLCFRNCGAMHETNNRYNQETDVYKVPTELIKEILLACDLDAINASDVEGDVVM